MTTSKMPDGLIEAAVPVPRAEPDIGFDKVLGPHEDEGFGLNAAVLQRALITFLYGLSSPFTHSRSVASGPIAIHVPISVDVPVKNELELIEAAKMGDTVAFGKLVTIYQDRLFHAMTHIVGSPDEAEDVVQEAMVQCYDRLKSFRQESAFYTWLYRIALNRALNRKRQRRDELSVDEQQRNAGFEPLDPGDAPGERLLRQERAKRVQQALARLSEEFRTIIVLREMEGFSYETIASLLNISVGTVRSRLHRARGQLRQVLRDVHDKK